MGVAGNVFFMRDDDDGVALLIELFEKCHDLDAGLGIQGSGGFIREKNGWIVHQRPGDGHALALTTR